MIVAVGNFGGGEASKVDVPVPDCLKMALTDDSPSLWQTVILGLLTALKDLLISQLCKHLKKCECQVWYLGPPFGALCQKHL